MVAGKNWSVALAISLSFSPSLPGGQLSSDTELGGRKQNKECITIDVCYNEDCSYKLPLDHQEVRRSYMFQNTLYGNMGCEYRNDSKAWMKQNIYSNK